MHDNQPPRRVREYALPALAGSILRPHSPGPSVSSTPHTPPRLSRHRRSPALWGDDSCPSAPPSDPRLRPLIPISKRSAVSFRGAGQYLRYFLPRDNQKGSRRAAPHGVALSVTVSVAPIPPGLQPTAPALIVLICLPYLKRSR